MKFASICRKSGKMAMSETTLLSLLKHDPSFHQTNRVSLIYPQVWRFYSQDTCFMNCRWVCLWVGHRAELLGGWRILSGAQGGCVNRWGIKVAKTSCECVYIYMNIICTSGCKILANEYYFFTNFLSIRNYAMPLLLMSSHACRSHLPT